jgi:hypothetical protein
VCLHSVLQSQYAVHTCYSALCITGGGVVHVSNKIINKNLNDEI